MTSRYVYGRATNRRGATRKTVSVADSVAVGRWLTGDRSTPLAAVDRDALIDRLDGPGVSAAHIAQFLGFTIRTVQRRRRARRAGEAV